VKYRVKFHIIDSCNLRCKDCHWFSNDVITTNIANGVDYIDWFNKYKDVCDSIWITGGEPTMHPDFIEICNGVPHNIPLAVCSNGTNIKALTSIVRPNISLIVSVNRELPINFKEEIQNIGFEKVKFATYLGSGANMVNQLTTQNTTLINKIGECKTREIQFASDGFSYFCEYGLRQKLEKLRTGFSLWGGIPNITPTRCMVVNECVTGIPGENIFKT
jgi:organic radical activating enzyme